jgi:hypothetical protein
MPQSTLATRIARHLGRCLLCGSLLAGCALAQAQPVYGLSPDAYAAFGRWMTTSCVGDEARALEDALRRHRAELAPAFRGALADGPAADDVQAVRRAAEARQAALARFPVAEYRIEGVSADALARHARTTPRDFANDQVQRYVTGYRSNALAGLGIVGGNADRALLARYASRRGDPLARPAAEAAKALDRR